MSAFSPLLSEEGLVASKATNRQLSLDVLRGLAILGILLLNICAFAWPPELAMNPLNMASNTADWWRYVLDQWLFRGRFFTLFALLFGVGLWLLSQRNLGYAKRRQCWLMLFGGCHLTFWWFGDILLTYGVIGYLLLSRGYLQADVARLWQLGHRCFAIGLLTAAGSTALLLWQPSFFAQGPLSAEALQQQIDLWTGPYLEQLSMQMYYALAQLLSLPLGLGWSCAALMLYGAALYKSGWFSTGYSGRKTALLFVAASSLSVLSIWLDQWLGYLAPTGSFPWDYLASLWMALAYGSWLIKGLQHRSTSWLQWLAPCGRMALSLYLLQSILMVLLFRWIRPDWFGVWGGWQLTGLALLLIVLQVVVCNMIVKRYSQGPAEAIIRRLARA